MSVRLVPKLKDRDLINAFHKIAESLPEKTPNVSYFDAFSRRLDPATLATLKKLNGYEIRRVDLSFGNCTWRLTRLEAAQSPDLDNYETIIQGQPIGYGHHPDDDAAFYKTSALISEKLSRPLASAPDTPESTRLRSHQFVLTELESVASKLISDTDEHRRRLDTEYLEKEQRRQEQLDNIATDLRKKAEEERLRLEADYAKRNATLDDRESGLNELKKQLDDRNNTHVRREIRSNLLNLAKERLENFTVSGTTKKQYWFVNLASITSFVMLAIASVYFGSKITIDSKTQSYSIEAISLIVKSASLAAAAIALGSWYLGWLNRWLQRIADSEFKLQQFRLDIERASWLAETVLEWKSTSEEPFPELLAARLSSGLFQSSGSDADGPRTPASHLAEALLGSASSAKLKLGDSELNFDRKGIQRLEE